MVAEDIRHRRRAAAIGNIVELEFGLLREQSRRQVAGGAEARMRLFKRSFFISAMSSLNEFGASRGARPKPADCG